MGAATSAGIAGSATAQDDTVANVYIEFSGGAVGRDMATVIGAFSDKKQLMPLRKYVPTQPVGLCTILKSELGLDIESCTSEIVAAIRTLSEKNGVPINPDAINPQAGVLLPEVKITETEASRVFNLDQKKEAQRFDQIEKNPSWQSGIVRKQTDILARNDKKDLSLPQLDELTFKRTAWEFGVTGADSFIDAMYLSQTLANRNLSVDVEPTGGFDKVKHSATRYSALDHYEKWCIQNNGTGAEGSFEDLAGGFYDTKTVVTCENSGIRPEVVIMDQAIQHHPDLAAAFTDTPPVVPTVQQCQTRAFLKSKDHGTLLSTIVAANANGYGFLGMAPSATIRSFVWDQKSITNKELRLFIRGAVVTNRPQVFLFASEFAPYAPHPGAGGGSDAEILLAREVWRRGADGGWLDLLANEQVRIKEGLAREVLQSTMLLVVSAGQAADGDEGREIHWETPMPPQNLGDYDKVLVVAACENCSAPTARLWRESNRGADGKPFVGLMAPGGGDIPTYLSDHEVGKTRGGTSASAAFVAGLAARMASCYPSSYNAQPGQLKERLILASRPIADTATNEHVGGGVIDPGVSMLDPQRDWLKLKGSVVRPVEFVKWCSDRLKLDDDARDPLNLLPTRRLSNADGVGIVQQRVHLIENDPVYLKRQVKRELPARPLEQDSRVAIVRYDSSSPQCAVNVPRLDDLFLSRSYPTSGDCSALPLCE